MNLLPWGFFWPFFGGQFSLLAFRECIKCYCSLRFFRDSFIHHFQIQDLIPSRKFRFPRIWPGKTIFTKTVMADATSHFMQIQQTCLLWLGVISKNESASSWKCHVILVVASQHSGNTTHPCYSRVCHILSIYQFWVVLSSTLKGA